MNTLNVQARKKESSVAELRRSGLVPGIVYGHQMQPQLVAAKTNDLIKLYKEVGESVLFSINGADKSDLKVVINDLSRDPMTGVPIHVDFYRVNLDKPIEADVDVVFTGISLAVKNEGGTLVKGMTRMRVRALPLEMPKNIEVDISRLQTFDDVIRVGDIALPEGVTVLAETDEAVASVTPPRSEEELKALDTKVEEDVEKVEVEEKGKKEEEAPAEGAAATPAAKPEKK